MVGQGERETRKKVFGLDPTVFPQNLTARDIRPRKPRLTNREKEQYRDPLGMKRLFKVAESMVLQGKPGVGPFNQGL